MGGSEAVNSALLKAIDDKRMLVLATVTQSPDSGGVTPTAKLLVDEDRRVEGTLGDSNLDERVIADALQAMEDRLSRVARYPLGDGSAPDAAEVAVFLEVVEPQPSLIVVGA